MTKTAQEQMPHYNDYVWDVSSNPEWKGKAPSYREWEAVQPKEPTLCFVYGTLKRGYGNNARCLANSKFLGEAISFDANYYMQGGIGVPYLSEGGSAKVKGELFEVSPSDFKACDRLEGHPTGYCRKERLFVIGAGQIVRAWVYLWPDTKYKMLNPGLNKPVNGVIEWRAGEKAR
jgi:gamma-glutamylaminecyclotransferase